MATTTETVPTGTYSVDPAHSNVGFEVRHMGIATVRGSFKKFTGTLIAEDGKLDVNGEVETGSIETGDENRDAHLLSPEFFDADQFPQLTLTSTSTGPDADDKIKLSGEITLHGVTKPIELSGEFGESAEDPWGNKRVGFEVAGEIDRREFGLDWNQVLPNGNLLVANTVKIILGVSAVKNA